MLSSKAQACRFILCEAPRHLQPSTRVGFGSSWTALLHFTASRMSRPVLALPPQSRTLAAGRPQSPPNPPCRASVWNLQTASCNSLAAAPLPQCGAMSAWCQSRGFSCRRSGGGAAPAVKGATSHSMRAACCCAAAVTVGGSSAACSQRLKQCRMASGCARHAPSCSSQRRCPDHQKHI